jgi:hypothetical protein
MLRRALAPLFGCALLLAALAAPFIAGASQNSCVMPTTGTVSGLTLVNDINACTGSILTVYSGGSAPSPASTGMLWWNTSTSIVSQYDGTDWNALWYVDATNHLIAMQIGGGEQQTIASASTTDLWSVPQSSVTVSGTTTITQLANNDAVPGSLKLVTFQGALTLTQGTPLGLPNGGNNITTAAGDYALVMALTATNVQVVVYMRATGAPLSSVGLSLGSSALAASATGFGSPINGSLLGSSASNQLTVALVGVNGSNASSTNPILTSFRSQTGNNSTSAVIPGVLTAALSMTLGSTDNMGCTTAVLCRLWVTAVCQTESAGACTSILLGLSNQSTPTQIYQLNEAVLQNTGSGTTGGTAAGTIQTSIASLSGKAIRIVGYVEAIWTSGTGWASPSYVQMFGPGIKKPGDVVQIVYGVNVTGTSTTSSTFQITGTVLSITPTSAANLVNAQVLGFLYTGTNVGTEAVAQLARSNASSGPSNLFGNIAATYTGGSINAGASAALDGLDAPNTTSATQYSVYLKTNGTGTGTWLGGFTTGTQSSMMLIEYMSALEPANDDGAPLQMVG